MGGLGNQMFQYAAGKALATKLGVTLKIDLSFLDDRSYKKDFTFRDFELSCFNIEEEFISKGQLERFYSSCKIFDKCKLNALNRIAFNYAIPLPKVFQHPETVVNNKFHSLSNNTLIEGYWQSEQYFIHQQELIREKYIFKALVSDQNRLILTDIWNSNSVSVHIRRGDYAGNNVINSVHGLLDKEYYERCISHVSSKIDNPVFFFFSDDIEWVKSNFRFLTEQFSTFFVNPNAGNRAFDDLRLMSNCKHNIIANSSFSWWGAWLNNNPEKIVIAPKHWFNDPSINTNDLIPGSWIRL